MAVEGQQVLDTIIAGEDLSGSQYLAIEADGTIAANNDVAYGLLKNKPLSGEHAALAVSGLLKGRAAAAISANVRLKVTTSGFITTVASGDGSCGKNLNAAVGSGDTFTFQGDFVSAATTI